MRNHLLAATVLALSIFPKAVLAGPATQPSAVAEVDTNPEATLKTIEKLQKPLPELRFSGNPLSDVIDFLRDVTAANIYVDWAQLEKAGIGKDAQISLRLKDAKLATVLDAVAKAAGPDGNVSFGINAGVIEFTSTAQLSSRMLVAVYDESKSSIPPEKLADVIRSTIDPAAWATGSSIKIVDSKLLITASMLNHRRIAELLPSLTTPVGGL